MRHALLRPRLRTTPGHGRDDADLRALGSRRLQRLEEPDVVVADVDVHEPPDRALLVEHPRLDPAVVRLEVVEHLGQGRPVGGHLGLAAGVGAQDGGDPDADAHGVPLCRVRSTVQRPVRERGVRRVDGGRRTHPVRNRVERLEAVTGVEHDRLAVGVELAGLHQLLQHADGHAARGLREDALGAGQQLDALADLLVVDVLDGAAGTTGDVEHVGTVGRVADRERLGDRVGRTGRTTS